MSDLIKVTQKAYGKSDLTPGSHLPPRVPFCAPVCDTPHLSSAAAALSFIKPRKLVMAAINTTKATETVQRIRGMTQERRLQKLNLLHAALGEGDKGRATIYKL